MNKRQKKKWLKRYNEGEAKAFFKAFHVQPIELTKEEEEALDAMMLSHDCTLAGWIPKRRNEVR